MSKRTFHSSKSHRLGYQNRRQGSSSPRGRHLHCEPLEDRRLLAVLTVDTAADTIDAGDGLTSLREAIAEANSLAGPDLIAFDPDLTGRTISLMRGEIEISETLSIEGVDPDLLEIDARRMSRVFNFTADTGDLTISAIELVNGKTDGTNGFNETTHSGGAIRFVSDGTLTLFDTRISGSSTVGDRASGGAIFVDRGDLSLTETSLVDNFTMGELAHGGAIYADLGEVSLTNSSVARNSTSGASAAGGGIFAAEGDVSLVLSGISRNSTSGEDARGGGLWMRRGNLSMLASEVDDNATTGEDADGGGIIAFFGDIEITDSDVIGNSTEGFGAAGGGIYSASGNVTLTESRVNTNYTRDHQSRGGGIYKRSGEIILTRSQILSNFTRGDFSSGGGIFSDDGNVTLVDSSITGNQTDGSSADGGGIWAYRGDVSANTSSIRENRTRGADSAGGGIATSRGNVTLIGSELEDNITEGENSAGGGVHSFTGDVVVTASAVTGNRTFGMTASGGGLHSYGGDITMTDVTVAENFTTGDDASGGGAFAQLGDIQLIESVVWNNNTSGIRAHGGGIATWSGDISIHDSSTLENQTSGGAAYGGAIASNFGDVTLTRSTVFANSTSGTSARGGGISATSGDVRLVESSVSSNGTQSSGGGRGGRGGRGGGIYVNSGDVHIQDSTISRNFVNAASGGGIFSWSGDVTFENSTLSENSSTLDGGGLSSQFGDVSLSHSTVTLNSSIEGGGLFVREPSAAVSVSNSIVAGNSVSDDNRGSDIQLNGGSELATFAYSVIGDNVGTPLDEAPTPDASGNLVGSSQSDSVISPRLNPLTQTGGPTSVHTFLPDSPAIDAGDPDAIAGVAGVPEFDQRGNPFTRVADGRIDMGAYEQQAFSFVVDTLVDESDGDFSVGDLSLREAIELSNVNQLTDMIRFDPSLAGGTILLTMGELNISDDVSIVGLGAGQLTIDATGNDPTPNENNGDGSRVINLRGPGRQSMIEVEISGLTITGGDVDGFGGGMSSSGNLTLNDVAAFENHAEQDGGGIWISGAAEIQDSNIANNSALASGGGLRIHSGAEVTMRNTKLASNSAGENGGGLWSSRVATTKIFDSTVTQNRAVNLGGGLGFLADTTTIFNTRIASNSAAEGGGIYSDRRSLHLEASEFQNNFAFLRGGGLFGTLGVHIHVVDSSFNGNSTGSPRGGATGTGGGIAVEEGSLQVEGVSFAGNIAQTYGGAITAEDSVLNVSHADFRNNRTAGSGGAIWSFASESNISESELVNNSASENGGALHIDGEPSSQSETSTTRIDRSLFVNNWSLKDGGAVHTSDHTQTTVSQSVFQNNRSGQNGGALNVFGALDFESSLVLSNTSTASGGGLHAELSDVEIQIDSSTFVRNRADSVGGGIAVRNFSGRFDLVNSTVSDNHASTDGSGVYFLAAHGDAQHLPQNLIRHSTITENSTSTGSGFGVSTLSSQVLISHSILFGNSDATFEADLGAGSDGAQPFVVEHSLIGDIWPSTPVVARSLLLGVNPQLQGLAPNNTFVDLPGQGYALLTQALSPGSPAINAGDPDLRPGIDRTPEFDQRGAPISRVTFIDPNISDQPVIDIGAYEWHRGSGGWFRGDLNGDQIVSGADFLTWQRNFGTQLGATQETGDATGDGDVDGNDLLVWQVNYPQSRRVRVSTASVEVDEASTAASAAALVDAALHRDSWDEQSMRSRHSRWSYVVTPSDVELSHGTTDRPLTREPFASGQFEAKHIDAIVRSRGGSPAGEDPLGLLVDEVFDKL